MCLNLCSMFLLFDRAAVASHRVCFEAFIGLYRVSYDRV